MIASQTRQRIWAATGGVSAALLAVGLLFANAAKPAMAGPAQTVETVTLTATPNPVSYGGTVTFAGTVTPAAAGETVGVYEQSETAWTLVGNTTTQEDGTYSLASVMESPGTFVARATDAGGNPIESTPLTVGMRPGLEASLAGSRVIGARLYLVGRLFPRVAGTVSLTFGGETRGVRLRAGGGFRVRLTTTRSFRYATTLRVHPAAGFVARTLRLPVRVRLVPLSVGSRLPAVRWLEYSLSRRHYALPGIDRDYGYATRDAVLAFQQVHRLAPTGSVTRRFWHLLRDSGTPLARIRSGTHIEVDKTRQVLFEVRRGKVVSVSRVSTGATGNTPVGHWHVYSKAPGYNSLGMYYSMYFLRGFALHGYDPVPTYPASHGCVRMPLWFAPRLYSRWGLGASVYVFP
jgi:hypothetical protein